MKKFTKVASFVAAFTMAMAVVMPTVAKADVTINVQKPADWEAISVHAWDLETSDISTWPGLALTQNGDKYSITIAAADTAKLGLVLNDAGVPEAKQTTNIDGLVEGQGEGLAAGTYDITIASTTDANGHYNWTLTKSGDTSAATTTTTTTTTVEENKTPEANSPKTADAVNPVVLGGAAVVLAALAAVFYRKRMAV